MDAKKLESQLAARLEPDREHFMRTWPRPAIQKLKEEIEALATERHARVLRLALQPDLEEEIKERLFQEMTNFEAASAELSDAVEAFEEAQRSLPERPRPNVRLRMR